MFEKFCQDKQIKGNYKEALYHHLMAKYSEYDQPALVIDQLKQEEYEAEWKAVLSQVLAKFNAA
jgi:cytolysin (calcineurin-like family phosphatase)